MKTGSFDMEKMLSLIDEDFIVSDQDYSEWKVRYELLEDYEKVETLLGVVSQYLLAPDSHSAASVMSSALVCTSRWCNEKDLDNF